MKSPLFQTLTPLYDIEKSYADNVKEGPFFKDPLQSRPLPEKGEWIDFLGYGLASRLGVAAGPLLTSKWVALAASLGFDLVTYKTIRSKTFPAHPLPNMVFVEEGPGSKSGEIFQKENPPMTLDDLGVTNSFGMPSQSPEFLMEDIEKANRSLREGQAMIVSVVGSQDSDDFFKDFIEAALLAKSAGAKIIEANFSCPNVGKSHASLYLCKETLFTLATALVQAIHPIPLILKVGLFPNKEALKEAAVAAARAGVRAICGINTIPMEVKRYDGSPALGANRLTSGICGAPIQRAALDFIADLATINREENLGLTVMGVGGILKPSHFDLFLNKGADIALTATGMMWDPYLAMRYHENHSCR